MNERVERFVKHIAVEVDATPDQQGKLAVIAKDAARELAPLREQAREARRQAIELFSAPNIDRAAIEQLRATHLKQADAASRRLAQALADAAEVLTPEQRKTLAAHAARHRGGWHRG
jgi:Spy/CpxP family protein refolding chaperone